MARAMSAEVPSGSVLLGVLLGRQQAGIAHVLRDTVVLFGGEAVRIGYRDQEVAELDRQFVELASRQGFERLGFLIAFRESQLLEKLQALCDREILPEANRVSAAHRLTSFLVFDQLGFDVHGIPFFERHAVRVPQVLPVDFLTHK